MIIFRGDITIFKNQCQKFWSLSYYRHDETQACTLAWVSITPFGRPVVPDDRRIKATSWIGSTGSNLNCSSRRILLSSLPFVLFNKISNSEMRFCFTKIFSLSMIIIIANRLARFCTLFNVLSVQITSFGLKSENACSSSPEKIVF